MSKGYVPDRHVIDLFPDATYCLGGLDSGKWITEHFKFSFKCAFYTEVKSGRTIFVNGREWRKILIELSESINAKKEIKEEELIV